MNRSIFVFILISTFVVSPASAEGIAPASYAHHCIPALKSRPDLLRLLAAFDVQDGGRCQYVPDYRTFPFVFPARLKGSNGDYSFLLVIDYATKLGDTHNKIIAGSTRPADDSEEIGFAIWPRIQRGNPRKPTE